MTRVLASALAVLVLTAVCIRATAQDDELAAHLARVSDAMGTEIAFREEHHGALYDAPAIYTGRLSFRAGDGALIKEIVTPEPARLTVTDRHVVMEADGRSRRLSLRGRPELRAMAGGFRALIEGDLGPLEGLFDATLEGADAAGRWKLTLTPNHERLAREVEVVIIDGHGDVVDGICTRLANGDWQHLELLDDG